MILLSKEFTRWVLIANIIAWPVAYFAMQKWLNNFHFRIELNIGVFIMSTLIALFVTFFTVSFQSLKAALSNPVESFQYE